MQQAVSFLSPMGTPEVWAKPSFPSSQVNPLNDGPSFKWSCHRGFMVPQEVGKSNCQHLALLQREAELLKSNGIECNLFAVQPVVFFPGGSHLGQLSSWWDLHLPGRDVQICCSWGRKQLCSWNVLFHFHEQKKLILIPSYEWKCGKVFLFSFW